MDTYEIILLIFSSTFSLVVLGLTYLVTDFDSMTLSAVKSTLERALDKDLSDLVRGIRAHKDNEVLINVL